MIAAVWSPEGDGDGTADGEAGTGGGAPGAAGGGSSRRPLRPAGPRAPSRPRAGPTLSGRARGWNRASRLSLPSSPGPPNPLRRQGPAVLADPLGQGVDPEVVVPGGVQRRVAEARHHRVQLLSHGADLRLAQPLDAQGLDRALTPERHRTRTP